jgi:hypothetical protein
MILQCVGKDDKPGLSRATWSSNANKNKSSLHILKLLDGLHHQEVTVVKSLPKNH